MSVNLTVDAVIAMSQGRQVSGQNFERISQVDRGASVSLSLPLVAIICSDS